MTRKTKVISALALVFSLAYARAQLAPTNVIEQKIMAVQAPDTIGVVAVGGNALHVAYLVNQSKKFQLFIDDQLQPAYDNLDYVTFSPDGKRVAYLGKKGDKWFVVLDGKEVLSFDSSDITVQNGLRPVVFSPSGQHWAFVKPKSKMTIMVLDGKDGSEYGPADAPGVNQPIFSPDEKHFAYVAHKDQKYVVVMDGKEGTEYEHIEGIDFSSDSQHLIYFPRNRYEWFMVIDGKEGPSYDDINGIVFTPDKQHVAFAAQKNQKQVMVIDGKEQPPDDQVGAMVFSPNGQHWAYQRADSSQFHMTVIDGTEHREFGDAVSVFFSPDSQHMAYIKGLDAAAIMAAMLSAEPVRRAGDFRAVIDGREDTAYDHVMSVIFSPTGSSAAYILDKNDQQFSVVFNGKESATYDQMGDHEGPTFSVDGKHLAFVVQKDEKAIMVMDGKEQTPYDYIPGPAPTFSPDGHHLFYIAKKGPNWIVVLDGIESPAYNVISGHPAANADGSVSYFAVRNNTLYRVTQSPSAK